MRMIFPGAFLMAAACVATAPPPSWTTPAPASSAAGAPAAAATVAQGRYRVTIMSASIASRRPDGSVWHIKKANGVLKLAAGVAGAALGSPELGMHAGEVLAGDDEVVPPRPYVELQFAGRRYPTYAVDPTLSPVWDHQLAVDLEGALLSEPVVLLVKDGVDKGVIGQAELTVGQLISRQGHTIRGMESVPALAIAVAPMPPRRSATHEVWVPADATLGDLAARGAEGWRPIPVEAGDVIEIYASGQSCLKPGRCYGPAGNLERDSLQAMAGVLGPTETTLWQGYRHNYPLFGFQPNGSLVGAIEGHPAFVPTANPFVVRRAGNLVLFINDMDTRNNSGGFRVTVNVNP